jgi:hypothetical protein
LLAAQRLAWALARPFRTTPEKPVSIQTNKPGKTLPQDGESGCTLDGNPFTVSWTVRKVYARPRA